MVNGQSMLEIRGAQVQMNDNGDSGLVAGSGQVAIFGIPATGRAVRVPYSVAYALAVGKITALRVYFPFELLWRQIAAFVPAADAV